MGFLKTSDDIKIYYQYTNKNSKKDPIVFVHGFVANWTCFEKEIAFFKKEGHPILYFDLRGHGKSGKGKDAQSYSFDRLSKDILELLKINKINKKIILIGYSLGGMTAINFASKFQNKVKRLVIIDSADKSPDQNKLLEKIQKNKTFRTAYMFLAQHYQHNTKKDEDITEEEMHENPAIFFAKHLICNDPKSILEITDTIFSKKKIHSEKIKIPTLIIGSSKDELFSKKEEIQLSKKIHHSIIKFFPGHHDIIMRQPDIISKEIKQFLYTKDEFFK